MKFKKFSLIKLIIRLVLLTMLAISPAFALLSPTVDGNVTDSEGYTFTDVPFFIKDYPDVIAGGKLGHAETGDLLYFGLILPQSIAGNTFVASGYVDKDGNDVGHTFADMEGSDKLEFKLKFDPNDNEIKLKLDYIDDLFSASVDEFKWKYKDANGDKQDVLLDMGKVDFNTSLAYNYDPNLNPNGDWVSNIMYEFSIEKDALDVTGVDIGDFLDLNNSKIHVSPNKLGDKNVYPRVPEPQTLLLLGCGLIGLAGFGRKKLLRK